jgi:hypothetical protein
MRVDDTTTASSGSICKMLNPDHRVYRFARNREDFIVFACNFTPVPARLPGRGPQRRALPRAV